MASRSLKAAVRRSKNRGRHRRHSLKSVNSGASYINYSSGPNREEMGLMKNRTGNTLFRNPKTGSIFVANKQYSEEFQAFWEARYPAMRYTKREMMLRGLPDEYGCIQNNPVPRGVAMRRAAEMLEEADKSMPLHFRWISTPELCVDIFLNSARTKFYLFELNRVAGIVRRSEIYSQQEIAMATYKRNRVHWEREELFEPET